MEEGKEYLIRIFIKKCTVQSFNKDYLDSKFKWGEKAFNIPQEKIKELKNKFSLDDYINRIIPVIDKHFSIEELKTLVQFFSSNVGRKMLDTLFLKDLGEVWEDMDAQLEQEFLKNNELKTKKSNIQKPSESR